MVVDNLGLGMVGDGQVIFLGREGFYREAFWEGQGKEQAPMRQAGGLLWLGSHGPHTINIIHKRTPRSSAPSNILTAKLTLWALITGRS